MARRQFADLGFLDPLCGMVQVRRRQTSSGRVNPGYGDPDRGTSVVQLRPIALRRGQFADLGYCRSHRCLHTCWRGRSMGPIFDHRETVMGAALAGAHSLRESRGAMARRRRLLFDLNAVAYTHSTNTLSMRSPNANLIYLPSRVSQVSCEDGQVFVEGQLTTSAYAC